MTATGPTREREVLLRRPAARCGRCRNPQIIAVCARCAIPLCSAHDHLLDPVDIREPLRQWRRALVRRRRRRRIDAGVTRPRRRRRLAGFGRAVPTVDARPGPYDVAEQETPSSTGTETPPPDDEPLRNVPEDLGHGTTTAGRARQRHRCAQCLPWNRPFDPVLVRALASAIVGTVLLTVPWSPLVGVLLIAFALVAAGLRIHLARRRGHRIRDLPAPPIAEPHVRYAHLREHVGHRQVINASECRVDTAPRVEGRMTIETRRAPGQRSDSVSDGAAVGGHVVLLGPGQIMVEPGADHEVPAENGSVVRLHACPGGGVSDSESQDGDDPDCPFVVRYTLREKGAADRRRLWVTPTFEAQSDRRGFEMHVMWRSLGPEPWQPGPGLLRLHRVRLRFPEGWGHIVGISQPECATFTLVDSGARVVEWVDVPLTAPGPRGTTTLHVRFADAVVDDEAVTGHVEAEFAGALSGLTGALMVHAGGRPRRAFETTPAADADWKLEPTTRVRLDVTLDPSCIAHQRVRTVPERRLGESQDDAGRSDFEGTAPDHQTVVVLCESLGRDDIQIVSVIENPVHSGSRRSAVSRSWSIRGRFHDGLRAVDFEISLIGEEAYLTPGAEGTTKATVQVRGVYAHEETERAIREVWFDLWTRVSCALRAREAPANSRPADDEDALAVVLMHLAHARRDGRITDASAQELAERIRGAFDGEPS